MTDTVRNNFIEYSKLSSKYDSGEGLNRNILQLFVHCPLAKLRKQNVRRGEDLEVNAVSAAGMKHYYY